MKTSLSIGFNDGHRFTHDYIKIEGVPVVPNEGQSVRFHWNDFIQDKALCQKLEDFEDDDMFLVHLGSVEYTKDEVIAHLILHEHRDYYKYYGDPDYFKTINFNDVRNSRRIKPNDISTPGL